MCRFLSVLKKSVRIFYGACCLACFLAQCGLYIREYRKYSTRTEVTLISNLHDEYPSFSVCPHNKYKTSKILTIITKEVLEKWKKEGVLNNIPTLGVRGICGKTGIPSQLIDKEIEQMNADYNSLFQFGEQIEDVLVNVCLPKKTFFRSYSLEFGNCFVWNPLFSGLAERLNQTSVCKYKYSGRSAISEKESFSLHFNISEYCSGQNPAIVLWFHSRNEMVSDKDDFSVIYPTDKVVYFLKKILTVSLSSPYRTNCVNYEEVHERSADKCRISREFCVIKCLYRNRTQKGLLLVQHIEDILPVLEHCLENGSRISYKTWNEMNITEPLCDYMTILNECKKSCPLSCKSVSYEVTKYTQTQDRLGSSPEEIVWWNLTLRSTYAAVQFMEMGVVEVLTMIPQIQMFDIFAYIGGYLGVWLGVSFLQLPQQIMPLLFNKAARRVY